MMDVQTSFVKMSAVPEEIRGPLSYAGITDSRMKEGRPRAWKTVCCAVSKRVPVATGVESALRNRAAPYPYPNSHSYSLPPAPELVEG